MSDTIIGAHNGTFKTAGSVGMLEARNFLIGREGLSATSFEAYGLEGSISLQKLYDASNAAEVVLVGNSAYASSNYNIGGLYGANYTNNTAPEITFLGPSVITIGVTSWDESQSTGGTTSTWIANYGSNAHQIVFKSGFVCDWTIQGYTQTNISEEKRYWVRGSDREMFNLTDQETETIEEYWALNDEDLINYILNLDVGTAYFPWTHFEGYHMNGLPLYSLGVVHLKVVNGLGTSEVSANTQSVGQSLNSSGFISVTWNKQ